MKKTILFSILLLLFVFCPVNIQAQTNDSYKVSNSIDNFGQNYFSANILSAEKPISIPLGSKSQEYKSPVIKSDYPYWMYGLKIIGTITDNSSLELETTTSTDNTNWSPWEKISLEYQPSSAEQTIFVDPIVLAAKSSYLQYKIILKTQEISASPQIVSVKITFIDPELASDTISDQKASIQSVNSNFQHPTIITRKEWGADESIMNWLDDMEHESVKFFVLHHTATPENSPLDPAKVVRGIYYYHAVEKGWGDIGYNYLIDNKGNIYEGRKGGLGVVAAHALGYNYGSVGISILGDYSKEQPSADSINSLTNLVAYISHEGNVDLKKKIVFKGSSLNMVIGHRDVNQTECPGEVFYQQIPSILSTSQEKLSNMDPSRIFSAQLLKVSSNTINLTENEQTTVAATYLNNSLSSWIMSDKDVKLVAVDPFPRVSNFKNSSWLNNREVSIADKFSIMPSDEAVFLIPLKGYKQTGTYTEKFALKGPDDIIPGTEFTLTINNQANKS